MLHLPITVKDTPIGVMGLYSDRKRMVTNYDVQLMNSIARQCGLAIQNASLYLELQKDKQSLEEEIWGHKAWSRTPHNPPPEMPEIIARQH